MKLDRMAMAKTAPLLLTRLLLGLGVLGCWRWDSGLGGLGDCADVSGLQLLWWVCTLSAQQQTPPPWEWPAAG